MKHIVDYANTLSLLVLAQALRINTLQRHLDASTAALNQQTDVIEALKTALLGDHTTYTMED